MCWIKLGFAAACFAALLGCESNLQPLRPVQRIEVWVPDDNASSTMPSRGSFTLRPTTLAATQESPATMPATAPATRPGHIEVKIVDPNQTRRFVYLATYDNIWNQARAIFTKTGFDLDEQNYRMGILTTTALPSPQIIEFWKPEHANLTDSMENTINCQRRLLRLTVSKVAGKPDFYEIAIQVLVERQTNPSEQLGGPVFIEGSGFGRNRMTLQSDYAPLTPEPDRWNIVGHDPDLEKKLLDELFKHI